MMNARQWQALFGLRDKLAVVTDYNRNASADIAVLLAAAGAEVILVDRDRECVDQALAFISDKGEKARGLVSDVTREAEVQNLFDHIQRDFRSPDILVNCAAVNGNGPITEFSCAAWDDVMSINLRSLFFTMRECIRQMEAAGKGGRIVNITTMGARHPVLNGNFAYFASRAGVTGLSHGAALDCAKQGILINEVMPGAIPGKVQFHENTQQAMADGYQLAGPATDDKNRLPLGYGKPEDIAAAVLYLVGPAGSYLTGQAIVLDGGFLLT